MGPGATGKAASAAVEAVLSSILSSTAELGKTHLPQFGTFEQKNCPARRAYNPASGDMITIPEHRRLTFRPADALKRKISRQKN